MNMLYDTLRGHWPLHRLAMLGMGLIFLISGCQGTISAPVAPLIAPEPATTQAAASLTDGCITNFDPTVDYFPDKVTVDHAVGFEITYANAYKLITIYPFSDETALTYLLVQCGAPIPSDIVADAVIEVPVRSIVTTSSTLITTLDEIGVLNRLVGLDELTYVSNPTVRQMAAEGKLTMIGVGAAVNVEQAIDLQPELIMAVSTGNLEVDSHPKLQEAGLTVVLNVEWLEESPLGRAEWSKYIAAFFNQEASAAANFAERAARYNDLKALAATATERPTVFVNTFSRSSWSIPGGNSYIARFLQDAGSNYLWAHELTNERHQLSFEEVYDIAKDAEFWVNTGRIASTRAVLLAEDARYADFAAVQNGNIWNNNARLGPEGGNEYWETGVAHPDVILADLIKIFHPELLPEHELVYYHQLR
jgi:iron complex transport system substrate-binding protein